MTIVAAGCDYGFCFLSHDHSCCHVSVVIIVAAVLVCRELLLFMLIPDAALGMMIVAVRWT